jgi:hypothetical protein
MNASFTTPVGPLRCLAIINSALPSRSGIVWPVNLFSLLEQIYVSRRQVDMQPVLARAFPFE